MGHLVSLNHICNDPRSKFTLRVNTIHPNNPKIVLHKIIMIYIPRGEYLLLCPSHKKIIIQGVCLATFVLLHSRVSHPILITQLILDNKIQR